MAQAPSAPKFEVASVRLHAAGDQNLVAPAFRVGRFVSAAPLLYVIAAAYNVPAMPSRLTGGPDWLRSVNDSYDIEATAPAGSLPQAMAASARMERARGMVQGLLADRFNLVIHRESRTMPIYSIVAGKGGAKLRKADMAEKDCADESLSPISSPGSESLACHQFSGGRGRGLHGLAVNLDDLANFVQGWTDRPVVNQSGIEGLYKIDTSPWLPIELGLSSPPAGAKQDGAELADLPTIFEVFEKMGLKLEPRTGSVDVYVIDSVARPGAN